MVADICQRIALACERSGRSVDDVTLVAVTKSHQPETIRKMILDHGQHICAENRIQEWRGKKEQLPEVSWHFIGNLQTNKVKYCTDFDLIHSLNSKRLADALERQGQKKQHVFRTLIEVNIAKEQNKHGIDQSDASDLLNYTQALDCVEVCGLMTMAPFSENAEDARPVFKQLRALRDDLGVKHLSMGMSGDFEVAIEEGASMVRIGTALFQEAQHEGSGQ